MSKYVGCFDWSQSTSNTWDYPNQMRLAEQRFASREQMHRITATAFWIASRTSTHGTNGWALQVISGPWLSNDNSRLRQQLSSRRWSVRLDISYLQELLNKIHLWQRKARNLTYDVDASLWLLSICVIWEEKRRFTWTILIRKRRCRIISNSWERPVGEAKTPRNWRPSPFGPKPARNWRQNLVDVRPNFLRKGAIASHEDRDDLL